MQRNVIILAAGKGTRMHSDLPKVLHEVAGKAMVELVLDTSKAAGAQKIVTVIGHGAQAVRDRLGDQTEFAEQKEQLGTAHAIQMTEPLLDDVEGTTIIMSGDAPLFTVETINGLFDFHAQSGNAVTVLTATAPDPTGYGRIVRDENNNVTKIVEQKDANELEQAIKEVNTGVYAFDNQLLFAALKKVKNDNAQGEYYLPDTLEILREDNHTVGAFVMADFDESMGVNDRVALARANAVLRQRINEVHLRNGVTMIDPMNTYIDVDVKIGYDTLIEPNVYIKGQSTIGNHVTITSGSRIENSVIGDSVKIDTSHLEQAEIQMGADAGPYAHLRPKTILGQDAHVGNFVELKNAKLGKNSKMGHLSYAGEAEIGQDVNIGAGTIFVNYDGMLKHTTVVGDRAFIGSNTKLIAPLVLADETITAAGSTITDDLPIHAMGIARSRQVTKADFWHRTPLFEKFGAEED